MPLFVSAPVITGSTDNIFRYVGTYQTGTSKITVKFTCINITSQDIYFYYVLMKEQNLVFFHSLQ